MVARGYSKMYLHTKVDNEGAQALFTRGGYEEPADAKAGLTQMQIAQRGTKGGPLAARAGGGWAPPPRKGTQRGLQREERKG